MARLTRTVLMFAVAVFLTRAPHVKAQAPTPGVVRAIMFWMNGCPHCHYVLDEVLPPLQQQYGSQFELRLIEVKTAADVEALVTVAAAYGRTRNTVGVPLLLIGDQALMGSQEVPARLSGLIEQYLSAGGVDWPSLSGPDESAAAQTPPASVEAGLTAVNGWELALSVLAGMVIMLVYVTASLVRGLGQPARRPPEWLNTAVPLLAFAGLGVAGYLAYVETQVVPAVCGPIGDCNAVQSSPYARLFGIFPIGVVGLAGYLAILAAWAWPRLMPGRAARQAPVAVLAMTSIGVLLSLYLTYLEPFVIGAVCLWCLSSAVLMTLLMAASLPPAVAVLAAKNQ